MSKAAKQIALPEELDGAELLPKEELKKKVQAYVTKQRERFEQRIEGRAARFEQKLVDKAESGRELIIKKIMIAKAQEEIKQNRATIKELRAEITAIRESSRRAKGCKKKAQ